MGHGGLSPVLLAFYPAKLCENSGIASALVYLYYRNLVRIVEPHVEDLIPPAFVEQEFHYASGIGPFSGFYGGLAVDPGSSLGRFHPGYIDR